jgi:hypothetical protein
MRREIFKLGFVLAFIIAGITACQVEDVELSVFSEEYSTNELITLVNPEDASTPISTGGVTPYIIPGANPGGNRTCTEVATYFGFTFDFSSGRLSDGNQYAGTAGPISWSTDPTGTYVTWSSTVPVKVAFIVKGSNQANVYFYGDCTTGDSGLASPEAGQSGGAAGLSNITICWTLCDDVDECYKGETAFGGNSLGGGPAWWYYYDTTVGGEQKIFAGQNEVPGATVEIVGDILTINLGGMVLQVGDETVKVQGYNTVPNRRPNAGSFPYKGTDLTINLAEAGISGFTYYVIHLDVMVPTPCPE